MGTANHRHAFTLIESVVSLSIAGVLLTGIGSSMLLASRALPGEDNILTHTVRTSAVVQDIVAELSTAITVTARTATTLTFTVADRNGDRLNETIRYGWSGVPGAPLTRKYNTDPVAMVLSALDDVTLTYELMTGTFPNSNLRRVQISMRATADMGGQIVTSVELLNHPLAP